LLPDQERLKAIKSLSQKEAEALLYDWEFWARPSQKPPDWDWFIWLILSGRGFGKTRVGNEMVIRWAQAGYSPIALLGQTKADVRDTIVELGESALLRISPPWFYPEYEPSKRRVTWPNGVVGIVYSGDEPDQLRGPQHAKAFVDELCLAEGTLIRTKRGNIPIEKVTNHDLVWTRAGYKRVLNAKKTGSQVPILVARFSNGVTLRATANHHIYERNRGFLPLLKLRYPDKIYTYQEDVAWQAKKSFIMDKLIIPIPTQLIQSSSPTLSGETGNCFTESFGKNIMVQFLKVAKSIISMATSGIITLRTWFAGLGNCIVNLIPCLSQLRLVGSPAIGNYEGKLPNEYLLNLNQLNIPVNSAENFIWQRLNGQCIALLIVDKLIGVGRAWIRKLGIARFAGSNLPPINITPQNVVPIHVLTVSCGGVADVYNLEVEGQPEYFANDILVHNCKFKYPRETWDNLMLGLRIGNKPQAVVATTPRPIPIIKQLVRDSRTAVTRGHTLENRANLAPDFLEYILDRYEGTRLGRQELAGEILDDNPDALWQRGKIDELRVKQHPSLSRVVVAIDPQATDNPESSETGIIVAGIAYVGEEIHGYVLADLTTKGTPDKWATAGVTGYYHYKADRIVGEVNNGGDMVEHTIRTVDRNVSFKKVHASRGKYTRAEPVSALYEQGRIHHVGFFPELEDQMCEWVPGDKSPDRLDALVWAITDLMLEPKPRLGFDFV